MFETPQHLALTLGFIGMGLELIALALRRRPVRRLLYALVLGLTVPSAVILLAGDFRLGTALIALVAAYRVLNAMRVIAGRTNESRLQPASRRTSLLLIIYQLAAVLLWLLFAEIGLTPQQALYGLSLVSLAVGLLLARTVRLNLSKTRLRPTDKYTSDTELPTVSVCIPARNESEYLSACLEAVLASDYPKLEVLVLDDCSHDRTSEVIKGFAQAGVRFINGEPPKKGWLAKNQAYQALSEAASGQLLLFMGVDVRLEKSAIRSLVGTFTARHKQMISVLPRGLQERTDAGLVQPMRYWWELALPRRLFNRPPVLSTMWMIRRTAFERLGGMGAVRGSVLPEGFFARELVKADAYSFMRASGKLAVSSIKRLPDQWQTALRVRYPRLRKRPENVLLLSLAELTCLCLPLGIFVAGFMIPLGWLWLISGLNACLLFYTHARIVRAWGIRDPGLAVAVLPAAVLCELAILHVSMWRYEFAEVIWKERNICIPVMKRYPRLPRA